LRRANSLSEAQTAATNAARSSGVRAASQDCGVAACPRRPGTPAAQSIRTKTRSEQGEQDRCIRRSSQLEALPRRQAISPRPQKRHAWDFEEAKIAIFSRGISPCGDINAVTAKPRAVVFAVVQKRMR
jgi:hypothetical protein